MYNRDLLSKGHTMANSNYLDKSTLLELIEYKDKLLALREEGFRKFNIDLLENDTLSALSAYEIIKQYDSNYNINFARNGEDGKSNNVLIEQKASTINKLKKKSGYSTATFQFHAQGDIEYDRYIFIARDKVTLEIIRMYDISNPINVSLVQTHLLEKRAAWEAKNKQLGRTQKHDGIGIPEKVLIGNLVNTTSNIFDNCKVIMA
jgi:hypothetical protein